MVGSSGAKKMRKNNDDPENLKTKMKTVNDLTRIDEAETKRLRKMERNKNSKNA